MYALFLSIVISVSVLFPTPDTTKKSSKSFSFAVIGDTQARAYITTRAVKSMNSYGARIKFIMHLGDIDWAGYRYLWDRSAKQFRKADAPWYFAIGNHELYSYIPHSYSTRKDWLDYWYGYGDTFRVYTHYGKIFVIIDTASSYLPQGHLLRLKRILKKAKNKSVFIFSHKPLPYPNNIIIKYGRRNRYKHRYKDMDGFKYKGKNKLLWQTLNKYKDKLLGVFHGHYHAFRDYTLDGIRVFCSGGGGGTVETKRDFYHYLLVTVTGNKYEIKVVRL